MVRKIRAGHRPCELISSLYGLSLARPEGPDEDQFASLRNWQPSTYRDQEPPVVPPRDCGEAIMFALLQQATVIALSGRAISIADPVESAHPGRIWALKTKVPKLLFLN